jgi:hypothetical protein
MRQLWVAVILVIFPLCAVPQETTRKPKVSDEPLTAEQIAVYRAVLTDYLKGSDGELNVANMTEPLDASDKACFRGMESKDLKSASAVIHRVEPLLISNTKIALVDTQHRESAIKENDPQNLIKKAIGDHQKVTNEQLDSSVKQAFRSGLFTLSEIVFDREHRRAVVAYGFVCGMLCGNGNTLVLKKIGEHWKVTKRCGGWVS